MRKNRKAQEQKSKILLASPKKAQEEIVGFALIIIVVAIILLVFIAFSLNTSQKETIESYEVDSFIQSFLQYTTNCTDNLQALTVQRLVFYCDRQENCLDSRSACDVLDSEVRGILSESWPSGVERPVKGYEMNITSGNKNLFYEFKGNTTANSKGSAQYFQDASIVFKAYY